MATSVESCSSQSSQSQGETTPFIWPSIATQSTTAKSSSSSSNHEKYTFIPIQLPPPASTIKSTCSLNKNINSSEHMSTDSQQKKLLTVSSNSSFSSLANLNSKSAVYSINSSSESPVSVGDKPDSGYQSAAQINSDSDSCI